MSKSRAGIAAFVGVILLVLTTRLYAEPPMYKEALTLCEQEYTHCTGRAGLPANPRKSGPGGCDYNKEMGYSDLQTWKKCREWCEAQHRQCIQKAADAFR